MAALLSMGLAVVSAALSHICVRHMHGKGRCILFVFALVSLGAAFVLGKDMGGLWVGIYTLVSIYFLVCMLMPWLDLAWERRRAG